MGVLAVLGLALYATSLVITGLAMPALARRAGGSGLLDVPEGRKDHGTPTPLVGGIAVLAAVIVPSLAGLFVALVADAAGDVLPSEITVHLPGIRQRAPELLAILAGACILLVVGYLDDRVGLGPWLRLGIQVLCALILCATGLMITAYLPWTWMHVVLTVLFVVFVTNAVNFIDNMNGLMGGVVLLGCLQLLTLAIVTGQLFMAAVLICLAGGLTAFLPANFPNARVFIGDAGSTALGFMLAGFTVAFTFDEGAPSVKPLVLPLLVLAVPIADGVTVVLSRLRRGVHPFTAGHDHLSHRLRDRGLTRIQTVWALWGAAFVVGVPALLMAEVPWEVLLVVWAPAILLGAYLLSRCRRGLAPGSTAS